MPGPLSRTLAAAAIGCAVHGLAAAAAADPFSILHHEKLQGVTAARDDAGVELISFEAYGRRFDLRLEPNERIAHAAGGRALRARALRGTVDGAPASWARLTLSDDGRWHGMFSDGREVYAIEPAADIEAALVQPAAAKGADPVVYRLSDALLPTGAAHCGTRGIAHGKSALQALEAIGADARSVNSATRRLLVSVIADHEFASFFQLQGTSAEQAIVARMNIVDGIFAGQLGVRIELAPPTVFTTADDPFVKRNANDLLEEVRRYRATSSTEMSRGITHLMTGRDMDGDTVGIAYIGTVCGGGVASSLSEGVRSTTAAALIAAHEIGHNFNAPHDGEAGTACASTSKDFLMGPQLTGSQQFSSCSIGQMSPLATSGWCLADVSTDTTTSGPDDGSPGAPTPGGPVDPGGGGGAGGDGGGIEPDSGGGGGMLGLAMLGALLLALRVRGARRALR
jgi:hypothetical protein